MEWITASGIGAVDSNELPSPVSVMIPSCFPTLTKDANMFGLYHATFM